MLRICLIAALLSSGICVSAAERLHIDLNGSWEFRTDPQSIGVQQEWHSPGVPFPGRIQVPGAWQGQGIGEPQGNLRHDYAGPAWYRREIAIPAVWQGKVIHLRVGGALRTSTLYVNGHKVGEHDGFSTPFRFDITAFVHPGSANTIALRIVNPGGDLKASPDAQVSSQPSGMLNYIGNWGGIYGDVELEATAASWIEEVAVTPDLTHQQASFAITLGGQGLANAEIEVASSEYPAARKALSRDIKTLGLVLPMPNLHTWSPDAPFLYTAAIRILQNGREIDSLEQRFGMREITTRGRVLLLNGKPLYLRGYGDDNVEVLTGVPPSSKKLLSERVRLARSFGFNAVRFHSMVPTEPFFQVADEAGLLVMAELPAAYTMHFLPHREYLKQELERTLRLNRNHPSFLSLAFGNEFNLDWLKSDAEKADFQATVSEFYRFAKSIDPKRLILSNDGLVLRPSDLFSVYSGAPPDAPTVRHEFGEYYCSLPDVSLIPKFTGVMRPSWLEDKKSWIEESGLTSAYPIYLKNSKRLQQIGRKFQIERQRRSPDVTGYHYWLGTDYPGGTGEGDSWEEGWFDYFWQPKEISPSEGQELNSALLIMIDAGIDKRTVWNDESPRISLRISNYSEYPLDHASVKWELRAANSIVNQGTLSGVTVALGQVAPVGAIELGMVGGTTARKLTLIAEVSVGGKSYRNHWDFWAFPHRFALEAASIPVISDVRWSGLRRAYPFKDRTAPLVPSALLLTQKLDVDAMEFLKTGGRVWLMANADSFGHRAQEESFFAASGGALGSLILDHPALQGFPHEGMFDLQFFNLLEGAKAVPLDDWPRDLLPIAGSIRTTASFLSKSKKLSRTGYIFEAQVGKGRLLISTLRIKENFDDAYPEALVLFDSLLRYATSDAFNPKVAVREDLVQELVSR